MKPLATTLKLCTILVAGLVLVRLAAKIVPLVMPGLRAFEKLSR